MDPTTGADRLGDLVCTRGHVAPGESRYCPECGEPLGDDSPPVWSNASELRDVIVHPPHLKMTLFTAAVVGTVLFAINQLDVVLAGDATTTVWAKIALTYLVPFVVSNIGILIATHRPAG